MIWESLAAELPWGGGERCGLEAVWANEQVPRIGRAVWALAMEKERKLLGRVGVAFWLLGEQSDPALSYR